MLWVLSGESTDPNRFTVTDSFHIGGLEMPAFDSTLIRLFKLAIIALEYVFAAIDTGSS